MSVQASSTRQRARELIDLVDAAPRPVLDEARGLLRDLEQAPDAEASSMLERVQGTALRVLGDLPSAKRSLVAAAEHGRVAGSSVLEGEALMSLGVVEAYLGDPSLGMRHFDRAESLLDGLAAARVVFQRSSIHLHVQDRGDGGGERQRAGEWQSRHRVVRVHDGRRLTLARHSQRSTSTTLALYSATVSPSAAGVADLSVRVRTVVSSAVVSIPLTRAVAPALSAEPSSVTVSSSLVVVPMSG